MEKENKAIIFSTESPYTKDDYKEYCEANEIDYDEDDDDAFYDWINEEEQFRIEEDLSDLQQYGLLGDGKETFLIEGSVGSWMGPRRGGIIATIREAIDKLRDEDYIQIEADDEGTTIVTANHDAGSYFNVWKFTQAGKNNIKILEAQGKLDNMDREEFHDFLLNTPGMIAPITRAMVEKRWGGI